MRAIRNKSVTFFIKTILCICVCVCVCISAAVFGAVDLHASQFGEFSIPDGYFDFPLKGEYGLEASLNATIYEWAYGERGFAYPGLYQFRTIQDVHEFHDGVDIWAPEGTPVYAAADGVIMEIHVDGDQSETEAGNNCDNWHMGNHLIILHDDGFCTVYCHLSGFAPEIFTNLNVTKGQLIGYVGHTGRCVGPVGGSNEEGNHLHFAISNLFGDGYRQRLYETRTGHPREAFAMKYPKLYTHYGCINPMYCFGAECIAWANQYYMSYGSTGLEGDEVFTAEDVWTFPDPDGHIYVLEGN